MSSKLVSIRGYKKFHATVDGEIFFINRFNEIHKPDIKQLDDGSLAVMCFQDPNKVMQSVHRLVAIAFLGCTARHGVYHVNKIKSDNRVENLIVRLLPKYQGKGVKTQNPIEYKPKVGIHKIRKQVNIEQVKEVKLLLAKGVHIPEISRRMGIPENYLRAIKYRKVYADIYY